MLQVQFIGLLSLVPFFSQEELSNLSTQVDYQNLLGKNGFFVFILFPFVVVFCLIIFKSKLVRTRLATEVTNLVLYPS